MTGIEIQEELRRRIRSREFAPGSKIPSLRELSLTFDVSHGLVQQAVRVLVAEGLLESEVGRGTFVPASPIAAKTVALVLPSLGSEHMRDIITGVKDGLGDDSYRLLLQVADNDYGNEVEMLAGLSNTLVAGAIVYPPPYAKYATQLAELVNSRQLPMVLVDTELPGLEVDAVTTHRGELGGKAIEHLLDLGHTRIGILDKDVDSTSESLMRDGMAQALRGAGLDFDDLPRAQMSRGIPAQELITKFLEEHRDLTAVVSTDDGVSIMLIKAARQLGLSVPKDFSFVALGDISAFDLLDPAITAVAQPHQEIGRVAAQRLLQRLAGDTSAMQSIWLQPKLIGRGSVLDLKGGTEC